MFIYEKKRLFVLVACLVLAILIIAFLLLPKTENVNPTDKTGFQCGDQINYQDDAYNTIQIGDQCWMKENLKTTKYKDDTPIPNPIVHNEWSASEEGAYSCYNNNKENCAIYGALYNWHAVNHDAGLCPNGWSVATHDQWAKLEKTICQGLGNSDCENVFSGDNTGWKGTNEGEQLQSADFAALLGGFRNAGGPFSLLREKGFWWTATPSEESAYGRIMEINNQGVRRVKSIKASGFSVRCISE